MAGPNIALFAKSTKKWVPFMWLDLQAGAMYSNPQSLQFFGSQTTPSKEIKTSNISFVYSPMLTVNLIKINKILINAKVGYSNYGGFGFGISITEQNCDGMPCYRCHNPGCNP